MIPLLKDQGLGLLVWSPLAGGFLSGKFTRDSGDEAARRAKFDFPPVDKEQGVRHPRRAEDRSRDVTASAFRRSRSRGSWPTARVTSVIIGAKKTAQLDDNLKAIDVHVDRRRT